MLLGTQRINEEGILEIGGCSAVELAREFGTPLYVVDEQCLRDTCRAYRQAFQPRYPKFHISFSSKVFTTMAVCRIVSQEGLGVDVSSGGELFTALEAGVPAETIVMHGSNKSQAEMEMAVRHAVGRVSIDYLEEIELLQTVAAERDVVVDILLRVAPGIEADTHTHIQTGRVDSKFGLSIAGGAAKEAAEKALAAPNLRLRGVNCHIGSQILEAESFVEAARMMAGFVVEINADFGYTADDLDLGGGLGVRYTEDDSPPSLEAYAEAITSTVKSTCEKHNVPLPRLILEPGRSLIGEAGVTLYTVGVVKEIPEIRTYVSVDGGLSDNPRPALYGARYSAIVANRANEPLSSTVTVSGKHCETDTLIPDLQVPKVQPGDIVAVQTTGAYNYSMASNYNRLPRPAAVLVSEGRADIIVSRETVEDVVRQDRIPERLRAGAPEAAS
ncbi:MAG: diaminopimelate decarboxylase [Armatimonadetes bacterium]|nr:diaminopimelate decarboxylase [Armatimonadota bacterium]